MNMARCLRCRAGNEWIEGATVDDELLDGVKRRVGVALNNSDASAEWLQNHLRQMRRFILEWESRRERKR